MWARGFSYVMKLLFCSDPIITNMRLREIIPASGDYLLHFPLMAATLIE